MRRTLGYVMRIDKLVVIEPWSRFPSHVRFGANSGVTAMESRAIYYAVCTANSWDNEMRVFKALWLAKEETAAM